MMFKLIVAFCIGAIFGMVITACLVAGGDGGNDGTNS